MIVGRGRRWLHGQIVNFWADKMADNLGANGGHFGSAAYFFDVGPNLGRTFGGHHLIWPASIGP